MKKALTPSPVTLTDEYQARYERHQAKKKRQLMFSEGEPDASGERRSQRVFNSQPVLQEQLDRILEVATTVPSSCNRHGLKIKVVRDRKDKELLGGLLVGGVGWVHRADTILLFLADMNAYKSQNERDFMMYCDAGFLATPLWLQAEEEGLGACYINPNIRHADVFTSKFGQGYVFCGALAIGNYDPERRALPAEKGILDNILL